MKTLVTNRHVDCHPRKQRERGAGWLTIMVFLAIFGAVGYVGYRVLPFYYYFYELQNQMEAAIKVASTETDEEIRKKLLVHIKKLEIPCEPEDLKIERSEGFMKIQLKYSEVFYITIAGKDYDIHRFYFDGYAEGKF
jgi:hypothetical protein